MGINFADDAIDIVYDGYRMECCKTRLHEDISISATAITRQKHKKYMPFKIITQIHDDWNAKQNVKTSL